MNFLLFSTACRLLTFPAHTHWQGCLASYLAAFTRYHTIMDARWFVSTDLAGNYFDLSCAKRKERRHCQDFSLSPVTAQHLLHGCMLRHETAPSFKRITSLPPSLSCTVFGGGYLDFKQKTLIKCRNHDVSLHAHKKLTRKKRRCFPQSLWVIISAEKQCDRELLLTTWLDLFFYQWNSSNNFKKT